MLLLCMVSMWLYIPIDQIGSQIEAEMNPVFSFPSSPFLCFSSSFSSSSFSLFLLRKEVPVGEEEGQTGRGIGLALMRERSDGRRWCNLIVVSEDEEFKRGSVGLMEGFSSSVAGCVVVLENEGGRIAAAKDAS